MEEAAIRPRRCPSCASIHRQHDDTWDCWKCNECDVWVCGEPVFTSKHQSTPCYVRHTEKAHPQLYAGPAQSPAGPGT